MIQSTGDSVVRGRPEGAAPFAMPPDPVMLAAQKASALRRSGIVRAVIAGLVASALFFFGRVVVGSIAASIATITLVLAIASPARGYAALSRAVDRLGELVGSALAWILLAPLFYLFFVPFRLLFRRGARDAMARGFDRSRASYWGKHEKVRDLEKPY